MKKYIFISYFLMFLISISSITYAQERTIKGLVTTLENIAVVNAEVKVSSSKVIVLTDSAGIFKVTCLPNDKLKVSANGFYSQKVKIEKNTNRAYVNLKIKPGEKNLDVALGYGHIKKTDKSYAISSIGKDDKFGITKYSNMLDVIANSSPSIILKGNEIIIRGSNSLLGSSAALILIDGIGVSSTQLSAMSPFEVKSIDILKGSSTAIYGSRGANGVILVTTKRGGDDG